MLLQMKQRRCPSPIVSFMVSLAGVLFFVLPVGVDLSVVDVLCLLSGAPPRLGCFLSKWACFLGVFSPLSGNPYVCGSRGYLSRCIVCVCIVA